MRVRSFAAVLAIALLCAWPASAQEQRGSIEGVVKDTSGAVLPGVTVEAHSAGSGVLTAVSDESGNYRFPSLLPGIYEVSATLSGFATGKVGDIEIKLGSIKKVDFAMQLAGVTEQVNVTAESPLVDVKTSGPRPTSGPSRSTCCRTTATSRRWSRRRRAPTTRRSRRAS
jgi:hypothetical protein